MDKQSTFFENKYLALWASSLVMVLALLGVRPADAAGLTKVTPCYIFSSPPCTLSVPAKAVEVHQAHGAPVGQYHDPDPDPPSVAREPQFMLWLLTRGDWHCLIRSETHPSVERQRALCFPLIDPDWTATNAPCAAPVFDDGSWACDAMTPWRTR
jgi:hypothetical protein